MEERGNFYNDGDGWTCRPCERELRPKRRTKRKSKTNLAPVKWTDATRRHLTCPRCGITEPYELS